VGVDPQPAFLNGVVVGEAVLDPEPLLDALLAIEAGAGRSRPSPGAARTLDLDLILYGDTIVCGARLILPHPRFRDRAFVLEPLAEVAGDVVHPLLHCSIEKLRRALVRSRRVRRLTDPL
jgi:2-amino-4-hydroxy-6-hydroxymethyldihydropteridine diphosphokinase